MLKVEKWNDLSYKRALAGTCAVLLLFLAAGCAKKAALWETETTMVMQPRESSAYFLVLEEWTRSKDLYEGFESKLFVNATYKSLPFREAYVDEYAERYRIDEDLKRVLIEREVESFEAHNEFFFAAATQLDSWNDFDKKDSLWKLYLEDDLGRRVEPLEVKRVEPQDQLHRAFFPYLDYWSIGYIVRFPRYNAAGELVGEGADRLRLVLTGVIGHAELEWGLQR